MSLLYTGTRDQALLAMVIQEAGQAAGETKGFVGRTAVQKILYHLSTMGVPMRYTFDIYHYGPFADDVLQDVELLMADGVIKDDSRKPKRYSNYRPGETIDELLACNGEDVERYRETVRGPVHALIPLRPEHMELIATLGYLYRWEKAAVDRGRIKERVLERFQEAKAGKFKPKDVENTYGVMVASGLFKE